MTRSIRGTLLLTTSLVMLLVLTGAGFLLHGLVERELLARLDRSLLDEARVVAATVEVESEHVPILAPRAERRGEHSRRKRRHHDDDEHHEDEDEDDDDRDEDDDEEDDDEDEDDDDDDDEDDEDDDEDDDEEDEDDDDEHERRRRVLGYRWRTVVEVEFAELDMPAFAAGGEALLEVRSPSRTIYRSPSLGGASLTPSETSNSGAWIQHEGRRLRCFTLSFVPRRESRRGPAPPSMQVVLARRAEGVEAAMSVFTTRLVAVGIVTLVLAALGLSLTIRLSLRPLEELSGRIAEVDPKRLDERIQLPNAPRELVPLIARTNELLARLADAFARERAFSGEVAHELRTPLAGLRTTLEVLLRRPREREEYQEALLEVVAQLEDLGTLVERLLQIGRLEAQEATREARPLDLSEVLLTVWEPLEATAREREVRVDWQIGPSLPALADANLTSLALRNLLENAVEHCDLGGQVWIRSEVLADRVEIEIENTGNLLEPSQLPLARRRFWRGEDARSHAGRHCGLGLALVDRAAASLGGALYLNAAEGRFSARLAVPRGSVAPES